MNLWAPESSLTAGPGLQPAGPPFLEVLMSSPNPGLGIVVCSVFILFAAFARGQDPVRAPETRPSAEQEEFERARDRAIEDAETIVITATRTPRPISIVPVPMSVTTRDEIILQDLSRTLVDSMRYTPG